MPDQLRFLCNGPSTLSLTLTLTFYLGQNCDLGEGRYSVTQKPQLTKRMRNLWESPDHWATFKYPLFYLYYSGSPRLRRLPLVLGKSGSNFKGIYFQAD